MWIGWDVERMLRWLMIDRTTTRPLFLPCFITRESCSTRASQLGQLAAEFIVESPRSLDNSTDRSWEYQTRLTTPHDTNCILLLFIMIYPIHLQFVAKANLALGRETGRWPPENHYRINVFRIDSWLDCQMQNVHPSKTKIQNLTSINSPILSSKLDDGWPESEKDVC